MKLKGKKQRKINRLKKKPHACLASLGGPT